MKRILLGVLLGVILTLIFQAKGQEIMRAVGLGPDPLKKAEKSVKAFFEDSGDAIEEVKEGVGEKVKETGEKARKMLDP